MDNIKQQIIDNYNIAYWRTDWINIIEDLAYLDKYLYLSYCMEYAKGDWLYRYYKVAHYGLPNLLANQLDKIDNEIINEIHNILNRILDTKGYDIYLFRDCDFNYNFLKQLVKDKTLLSDYEIACKKLSAIDVN